MGFSDLGCHGSEIPTPNLDKLAAGGLRFTQFYNTSRCCPTRASLLTGLYSHEASMGDMTDDRGEDGYRGDLNNRCVTIAEVLQGAGYRTAMAGKWHVGTSLDFGPETFGFDYFYGIRNGGIDPITHLPSHGGGKESLLYRNKQNIQEPGHVTDLFAKEAVQWLGAEPGRPFFLYLPFTAPHSPLVEAARWTDLYPSEDDADRKYFAAISHLDEAVGKVLAEVERLGQRENTLIVFLSDNGRPGKRPRSIEDRKQAYVWDENVPFRGQKGNVYEGGIHTPGLAFWPGHLKPGTVTVPLHITDWMPTFCDLAGYRPNRDLKWDGSNILPLLQQEPDAGRPLYTHGHFGIDRALIDQNWKLVITTQGATELYDLATDVGERKNLAAEHPEIVQRLQSALKEASARDGDAKAPAQK